MPGAQGGAARLRPVRHPSPDVGVHGQLRPLDRHPPHPTRRPVLPLLTALTHVCAAFWWGGPARIRTQTWIGRVDGQRRRASGGRSRTAAGSARRCGAIVSASPTLIAMSVGDSRANASSSVTSSPTNTVVATPSTSPECHQRRALVGVAGEGLQHAAAGLDRRPVDPADLVGEFGERDAARLASSAWRTCSTTLAGLRSTQAPSPARSAAAAASVVEHGQPSALRRRSSGVHRLVAGLHAVRSDHLDVVAEAELGQPGERATRHDGDVHVVECRDGTDGCRPSRRAARHRRRGRRSERARRRRRGRSAAVGRRRRPVGRSRRGRRSRPRRQSAQSERGGGPAAASCDRNRSAQPWTSLLRIWSRRPAIRPRRSWRCISTAVTMACWSA